MNWHPHTYDLQHENQIQSQLLQLIIKANMRRFNPSRFGTPFINQAEDNSMQALLRMLAKTDIHEKENTDKHDPCKKYLGTQVLIKKDGYGLEKKLKKLKSTIVEKLSNAKDLMVYKSKVYPMIFFKYTERLSLPKYKHLRQIFRECPKLREKRQLIDSIFERLFLKVERGYFNIGSFALDKAQQIKVKMQKGDIFNLEQGKQVMFYFLKNEDDKTVKFTIFDRSMRSIEFDSEYIEQKKKKHPEDYKLYQKFMKNIFQEEKEFQLNDIFDNEELESDQEVIEEEKMNIYQIKQKLNEILTKDLSQLQSKIQSIEEEIDQAGENNQNIKVLTEKKEDIFNNINNFSQTKAQVLRIMRRQSSHSAYKNCLKKMIVAEKQLESQLPIVAKKRKIFELLKRQNFILLEGQTGSGKSTQLPQMLGEFYNLFDDPSAKPVLVTQPRRLAARSLAERVASQMGEHVGSFVDYVASAGKTVSKEAKIIFKLDRLVLDEITEDPLLTNYSCLVIDEAHERTISIDVILALVKQLLKQRKDFKVIVTSASMDIPLFQRYFKINAFKVSGQIYPIKITYKDYEKVKEGDQYQTVHKIRKVIDEEILHDASSMKSDFKGHLLCFCSSVEEINQLVKFYTQKLNKNVFSVYPLHGKISPKDQKRVFQEAGKHKIIFASRIAETAITIDGVRVVIDPGQDIQLVYDRKYKVSSMKLKDISQSSAKQRAGRSGRTGPGHCFRLYSEESFKKRKRNKAPQIQNSSLETAVLRLKTIKIKDVLKFPFISSPDEESLRSSLDLLQLIGALKDQQQNYEPTEIGKLLVKMPIEPFLGRAIIESMIFEKAFESQRKNLKMAKSQIKEVQDLGIMETTIQILSLLINFSGLFLIDKSEKQKGEKVKYTQFSDEDGDFFFLMNIFNKYKGLKQSEMKSKKAMSKYYKSSSELSKWISKNYLNTRALVEAEKLAQEITFVAQKYFIHQILLADEINRVKQKLHQCKSFKQIILSSLITSFCSNLCKFSGNPQIGYTIVTQKRPIRIYGTSNLQLLGINADWIICFDLYTNEVGRLFCKVAHQVSYSFLKVHVHEYVWKKYKIQSIQDNNPFYEELSYDLPTKIIQQIRNDFQKQEENSEKLPFLKDMFPIFNEFKNRVSFFLIIDEKNLENTIMEKREKINYYIKQLKQKTASRYEHNFVGSIYANFDNGLIVNDIEFKFNEFCVEITSVTIIIEHFLKVCSEFGKFTVFDLDSFEMRKFKGNYPHIAYQFKKLRFIPHTQEDKIEFLQYVEEITKQYKQIPIEKRQIPLHQGNKTSQSKVYLYFYAGKCVDNNTIFVKYDTRNQHDIAFKMLDALKLGAQKKSRRAMLNGQVDKIKFMPEKMKPCKKRNGINFFDHNFDQFQLSGELQRMAKEGFLPENFVFPSAISKFRDPVLEEASKNDYQWRQEIYSILKAIKLNRENLIINITGFNNTRKNTSGQFYGKNIRVIMTAQIFSVDNSNLEQIKPTFQGKRILGCEKMHVRNFYDQTIALVNKRVFEALEFSYFQLVDSYKTKFPQMRLMKVSKKVRNEQKILIIARSQNKGDSNQIQFDLQRLFTPKLLRLHSQQFRFLDKLENGQAILDDIEQEYNYKIYFAFEKYNKCLKIYCKEHELKVIEASLKARIKSSRYCSQTISYRGKNLNIVRSILDKYTQNTRKEVVMTYEIKFQSREISITAELDTFQQIKQKITKIAETSRGQCEICADSMQNPYQFLNCSCSFCWQCITEHIRSFRNSMEKILLCPSQDCKTPININDVKTIMNEQQFQAICDLKIRQYLEIHHDKYYSCNVCQHVMDRTSVDKNGEMNCEVCGRNQCLKCHQSHQGYSCYGWKDRNNLTSKLTEFGIKICKNCGQGIQKNGGCNHMTCTRCKAHICWKCQQVFDTKDKCENHLIREHNGIFDDGIRE